MVLDGRHFSEPLINFYRSIERHALNDEALVFNVFDQEVLPLKTEI